MTFTGTLTSPSTKALTLNAGTTGDVTVATALANTATYTDVAVTGANLSLQAIATTNSLALNPTVAGTVGVISGASSTLTKGAAGVMNLTAANTYGGATIITARPATKSVSAESRSRWMKPGVHSAPYSRSASRAGVRSGES